MTFGALGYSAASIAAGIGKQWQEMFQILEARSMAHHFWVDDLLWEFGFFQVRLDFELRQLGFSSVRHFEQLSDDPTESN